MENKTCRQCLANFTVSDDDLKFYKKISPEFFGRKYLIPSPTLCPECRLQRRMSFRNIRKVYRRKSDKSGKELISMYAPNSPFKVYSLEEFESDDWDGRDFGQDFDFSRSFFEQFRELQLKVPRPHASVRSDTLENAEFINGANNAKNVYMSFSIMFSENIYFSDEIYYSTNCLDCYNLNKCELCYQCIESTHLYNAFYCRHSHESRDIYFGSDLRGCQNCFGCAGLSNKQYYIYNQPVKKEEFENFINNFDFNNFQVELKKLEEKNLEIPHKCVENENAEDSTGSFLMNVKNCQNCFECFDAENIKNGFMAKTGARDSHDVSYMFNGFELCYESVVVGHSSYLVRFCEYSFLNMRDIIYCDNCNGGGDHLFGCVGLRKKSYCILNKQYTQEEYEQLVPIIIEHMQKTEEWGEFFPINLSCFGYNESCAIDNMPLTREQAKAIGANWQDEDFGFNYDGPFYTPKNISNYDPKLNPKAQVEIDELLKGVLKCQVSGKPFRLIPQEVAFYIEHHLPIPTKHPNQRSKERFMKKKPRKLWPGRCMCEGQLTGGDGCQHQGRCTNEFETTYAPERPEKVYCEECYRKSVL